LLRSWVFRSIAYGFLALVAAIQQFLFTELPNQILGSAAPAWWPLPWLVLCGLLTGLTIRYLPGNAGHSPAFGFKAGVVRQLGTNSRASSSPR
jgi:H+/Cl- antiporter ClcA